MTDVISNLLHGYNSSNLYVIAVSGGRVVFINNAASFISGGNYIGRDVSEMVGEETANRINEARGAAVISIDAVDFFDNMCKLDIFSGNPTLCVFSPDASSDAPALEALSTFAYSLRKPMTAIFAIRDSLLRIAKKTGDTAIADAAAVLDRNSYHVMQMLERVSILNNLTDLESEMKTKLHDLTSFCRRVAYNVNEAAKPLGIEIEFEPAPVLYTCFNGPKIEQALLCLLSNALMYSAEGSKITVSVSLGETHLYVRVSDQGTGIPPETQAGLGEILRFDRPAGEHGAGLGLRVVREIVAKHGGIVVFESQPGEGTTVTFSIAKTDCETDISSRLSNGYEPALPYLRELSGLLTATQFAKLRQLARELKFPEDVPM